MYTQFFGLRERPFGLTSNLKYFLLTPKHQEAQATLEYGLADGHGVTLLLGEAGTGKTTLLRKALAEHLPHSTVAPMRWAYLNNPRLRPCEFFDAVAHAFQLGPEAARSKSTFLRELEYDLAVDREKRGLRVLVVDEAQSLPDELLEEVRLLANIETDTEKLLRIVIAGQPGLGDRLNQAGLPQLKQRISLRCTLSPLDLEESAVYIAHRIALAGGDPAKCFSREAVMTIYESSRGILRTINVIADNALLTGFAADQRPVGREIVLEVCRDFDLTSPVIRAPAPRIPATHDSTERDDTVDLARIPSPPNGDSGQWFSLPRLSWSRR